MRCWLLDLVLTDFVHSDQVEQDPDNRQAWFRSMWEGNQDQQETPTQASTNMDADSQGDAAEDVPDDEDDFGDDFDDFAEGGEDDDFGDFDESATPAPVPETQTYSLPDSLAGLVSALQDRIHSNHVLIINSAQSRLSARHICLRSPRRHFTLPRPHFPRSTRTPASLSDPTSRHVQQLTLPL